MTLVNLFIWKCMRHTFRCRRFLTVTGVKNWQNERDILWSRFSLYPPIPTTEEGLGVAAAWEA